MLALACLLYVMDLTVLDLAIPAITADLRPTSTQLLWIIDVYGFMVAGALVTMGTLGDRIGRRRLLLIGAAAFGAVSVLAAFSTTPEMLILSRALLGLAGATIAPSTLSLIFHMFPDPRQRTIAVGVWIGAFSAGSAVGPVLGGVLLEVFWWGSVFLLALPVMGALLVLGPRVLPEYRDPKAGRLDLISAGMSVLALLAMVYGVKLIAQDGPSDRGGAGHRGRRGGGLGWVRRQRRLADPMIDVGLFRIRTFNVALLVNFVAIFVMVGYVLYIAQYLQLVLGMSPLEAGLWSVPGAVGFVVGSQLAPRLVSRVRPATLVAGGLAAAAAGLFAADPGRGGPRAARAGRRVGGDLARHGPGVRPDHRDGRRLGAGGEGRGRVRDLRDRRRAGRRARHRRSGQRRGGDLPQRRAGRAAARRAGRGGRGGPGHPGRRGQRGRPSCPGRAPTPCSTWRGTPSWPGCS